MSRLFDIWMTVFLPAKQDGKNYTPSDLSFKLNINDIYLSDLLSNEIVN